MATHLNADRSSTDGAGPRYGPTFLATIQKAADRHLLEKNEIRDALGLLKLYHRASSAPATTAPAPDERDEPDSVAAADRPGAKAAASLPSGSKTCDSTAAVNATSTTAASTGYKTRQSLSVTKSKSGSVEASPNKRRKDASDHSKAD